MPQVQKKEIRERVLGTALRLFAEEGYQNVTLARISNESNVSVGNIYHYFSGKSELFDAVFPKELVDEMTLQIKKKIMTGKNHTVSLQRKNLQYILNSEKFLEYIVKYKYHFQILKHVQGTPYAGMLEQLSEHLSNLVYEKFVKKEDETLKTALNNLYNGYFELVYRALKMDREDTELLQELKIIDLYHVAGITAIID